MRAIFCHLPLRGDGRDGTRLASANHSHNSKFEHKILSLRSPRANWRSKCNVANRTSLHEPLDDTRPVGIDYRDVVLVQAFTWESADERGGQPGNWYRHAREAIPLMQKYHLTHVWLPPPSQSLDRAGYMPQSLYDLDSAYGTFEELRDLNRELYASSLRPVADIVMNHRCPDGQDKNGTWNQYRDEMDHPGATIQWDSSAIASDDPVWPGVGDKDTGKDYPDAPDLDHTNLAVVEGLTDWLRWMRSHAGFEGACVHSPVRSDHLAIWPSDHLTFDSVL